MENLPCQNESISKWCWSPKYVWNVTMTLWFLFLKLQNFDSCHMEFVYIFVSDRSEQINISHKKISYFGYYKSKKRYISLLWIRKKYWTNFNNIANENAVSRFFKNEKFQMLKHSKEKISKLGCRRCIDLQINVF